nr:PH domain-containing protein [Clostridiales bacterium]
NNRLYIRKGLFNTTEDEILLYRVLDVTFRRTLGQKIFGVGSIFLNTADQTAPVIELKNVKNSDRVRKALSAIVEKERDEKRVLGKEMFGSAGMELDDFTAHSLHLD